MRRKVLLLTAMVVLILGALLAYVLLPVVGHLRSVRQTLLSEPLDDLDDKDVATAVERLESAHDRLSSPVGRVLGWVPVIGSNLDAVDLVTSRLIPVLRSGLELKSRADGLAEGGLIENNRVQVSRFGRLLRPLKEEIDALDALEQGLVGRRSGSLAPPLWNALDDLLFRTREFLSDATQLRDLLDVVGPLLGTDGRRTYLVLLINNAELRGAGGILAGLGTISIDNGKLTLGRFQSVHDLQTEPPQEVPSPADYERFEKYGANSTIFLNATYSPDTADDARVTADLYELVTGESADGAVIVDPRGLAALLPDDATVEAPGGQAALSPDELPRFVYSDAYEAFRSQRARRDALLRIGAQAFRLIIDGGLRGEEELREAGEAISGGHVRVVSFQSREAAALDALGASGKLPAVATDTVLVAAQNRGGGAGPGLGSKMDYWAERRVQHRCRVDDERAACTTRVSLKNIAPQGLSSYVTGFSRPYGLLRDLLEIYVPHDAEAVAVEQDGRPARFLREDQGDLTAIGTYVQAEPGEEVGVEVYYELATGEQYSLVAIPQPLARDASIEVELSLPTDWTVRGPGELEDDVFRYTGTFDSALSITARPDQRTGIPALWDALTDFWREPLF